MAHRGRRRSQQARSLEMSGFTGVTVDQAHRLGVVGFDGSTDPMVALS